MAATNGRLDNGAIYFDSSTIETFASATLPYGGMLGMFVNRNGIKYQLVQLDSSSVTTAAGHATVWIDADDFTVTNDISDSIGPNVPAGILLNATGTTTLKYVFIQVRGPYATVLTDGGDDIAAGDHVYVDPSVDGAVDSTASGTASLYVPIGVASAADVDANNTVAVWLNPPLNG